MRTQRRQRGQATVELVLGVLLFIVVLLVGVHLAEVSALSLKVQEAQTFAVWEAAGSRMQHREVSGDTNDSPYRALLGGGGAAAKAKDRYQDFNGLSSVDRDPVISTALTKGSAMSVSCREEGELKLAPSHTVEAVFWDVGSIGCVAQAKLEAIRVPHAFSQEFNSQKFYDVDSMTICGVGVASGGSCAGSLAVMANEWAMVGDETVDCPIKNGAMCSNSAYRGAADRAFHHQPEFDVNGAAWPAGNVLARNFAGGGPVNVDDFNFSFVGVGGDYQQDLKTEKGVITYHTGGANTDTGLVYQVKTEAKCFLGRKGPGCTQQ